MKFKILNEEPTVKMSRLAKIKIAITFLTNKQKQIIID